MDEGGLTVADAGTGRPSTPRILVEGAPVAANGGTGTTPEHGRDPGMPRLDVPGMVLLAAATIFAGYYWLHLIPHGSLRPSGLLGAVVVVPVTFGLTRHGTPGRATFPRWLARGAAAAMPVLALVGLVVHHAGWTRALGAASLVLAASLLALAAMSERYERPRG